MKHDINAGFSITNDDNFGVCFNISNNIVGEIALDIHFKSKCSILVKLIIMLRNCKRFASSFFDYRL